jgi:hypothetical protein
MEDIEVWKQIDDYDHYEVSSFGNIRNTKTGRVLKAAAKGGYYCVGLCKNGGSQTSAVHRLVAKAFLPNPEDKPQVNHKDKNGLNNSLDNLEWTTNRENSIHRSNGVQQTTNQNLEICKVDATTNEIIEQYSSIEDGARSILLDGKYKFNNVRSGISMVINKRQETAYGYKWRKVQESTLENEEWREIVIEGKDSEGYFVSSLGRFKNRKGVIMKDYKPHHSGYIYLRVNIDKYALHRLVAQTFIPNPDNKPFVNHIDGNKTNNSVSNLEWVTCAENNLHNHKAGLLKCYSRKIVQYDLEMNELKRFNKILDASKELNLSYSGIKAVLYKKQNTSGGFIWKYLD